MRIRAEPGIVSQVPAGVVRVVINHNLIRIPNPAIHVTDIVGSHAEIESSKPEALRPAACQSPEMALADAAFKAPVFPNMIDMVMRVIAAAIVSYPLAVGMDVGRLGMLRLIGECAVLGRLTFMLGRPSRVLGCPSRRRPLPGYVSAADILPAAPVFLLVPLLGANRHSQHQSHCK